MGIAIQTQYPQEKTAVDAMSRTELAESRWSNMLEGGRSGASAKLQPPSLFGETVAFDLLKAREMVFPFTLTKSRLKDTYLCATCRPMFDHVSNHWTVRQLGVECWLCVKSQDKSC